MYRFLLSSNIYWFDRGCFFYVQDWAERSEDQGLLIERILVLIRNVLTVPASPDTERRADNDASLHDQVLWALQQSGVLDLVLYIIGSEYENQYHLHALEIVCLMYREQVIYIWAINYACKLTVLKLSTRINAPTHHHTQYLLTVCDLCIIEMMCAMHPSLKCQHIWSFSSFNNVTSITLMDE